MNPTELDEPGDGAELLPQSRPSPLWRWVAVAVVAATAAALTVRVVLTEHGGDARHVAATSSRSSSPTVPVVVPVPPRRAHLAWAPRLDAPHVPCPERAGCAYIVGATTVQDSAALPSAFPGAVVQHSVTFFAIRRDAAKVLSRRVVATDGATRIVVTLRRAHRFADRTHVRAGSVEVTAFVGGYAVRVTARDPAGSIAVSVERATSLAHDPRLLLPRVRSRGSAGPRR
jgi:hypothetical protein